MKIFQLTRKNFAVAGIDPSLVKQPYPFNRKIFMNFFTLLVGVICNLMHSFYEAQTFGEHLQSIYMCSLTVSIILALAIVLLNVDKFFSFMDASEKLVNRSELQSNRILPNVCTIPHTLFFFWKRFQLSNSSHRMKYLPVPIKWLKSWVKLYFSWCWRRRPPSLLSHGPFTYFSFIWPPIWGRRLLNCQRRCGKHAHKNQTRPNHASNAISFGSVCRLPFNWRNPFGFLIAIAIHCTLFWHVTMIGACLVSFAIGCYCFAIATIKLVKVSLLSIGQRIGVKRKQTLNLNQLIEYIELHSYVKK